MWWHNRMQPGGTPRTDFECWNAGELEGPSMIPWGQQTSGRWLMRVFLDLACVPSFVVRGYVEPTAEVAKVQIVSAWRRLCGRHWCTSWRSGPKRASGKECGPMTPPGPPLKNQQPLDSLDNWDPLNNRNRWLRTLPFALLGSILLPLLILLPWPILVLRLILLPRPIPLLGFALLWLQVHPVHHLLVHPLPVCPPPVAHTLGGLSGGGLHGMDDYNPPGKWVALSWPISNHHAVYVSNCVRYCNDDEDTIRILHSRWSHGTIRGPKLREVSPLGRPGAMYIGLIYKSSGIPQSLAREKMVFIERDKDVSTWLKLTCDEDIPNPVLLVLPEAVPDADVGRLLASVWCILCWLQSTAFTWLMNLLWLVV